MGHPQTADGHDHIVLPTLPQILVFVSLVPFLMKALWHHTYFPQLFLVIAWRR